MDFGEEQRLMSSIGDDPHSQAVTGMFGGNLTPQQLAALFLIPHPKYGPSEPGKGGHYSIIDETHAPKGFADLSYNPRTKNVMIENVQSIANSPKELAGHSPGSNAFGPADSRSLLRALKGVWPDAVTTSGTRVSGARAQPGEPVMEKWPVNYGEQVKVSLPKQGSVAPPQVLPPEMASGPRPMALGIGQAVKALRGPGNAPPGMSLTDLW